MLEYFDQVYKISVVCRSKFHRLSLISIIFNSQFPILEHLLKSKGTFNLVILNSASRNGAYVYHDKKSDRRWNSYGYNPDGKAAIIRRKLKDGE